ncbi:hypothetical protein VPH35_068470 [Triticum aestivum]
MVTCEWVIATSEPPRSTEASDWLGSEGSGANAPTASTSSVTGTTGTMDSGVSSWSHERASELGANIPNSSTSPFKDATCTMAIDEALTEPTKSPQPGMAGD